MLQTRICRPSRREALGGLMMLAASAGCAASAVRCPKRPSKEDARLVKTLTEEQRRSRRTIETLKLRLEASLDLARKAAARAAQAHRQVVLEFERSRAAHATVRWAVSQLQERLKRFTIVALGLDPWKVHDSIDRHGNKMTRCPWRPRKGRTGTPKVRAVFVIDAGGRPRKIRLLDSDFAPAIGRCLKRVLAGVRFPRPRLGLPVPISYVLVGPGNHKTAEEGPWVVPFSAEAVTSSVRLRRGCSTDSDCVDSKLDPRCCVHHCCGRAIYNRRFLQQLKRRLPRRCRDRLCRKVKCARGPCRYAPIGCVRGLCQERPMREDDPLKGL